MLAAAGTGSPLVSGRRRRGVRDTSVPHTQSKNLAPVSCRVVPMWRRPPNDGRSQIRHHLLCPLLVRNNLPRRIVARAVVRGDHLGIDTYIR